MTQSASAANMLYAEYLSEQYGAELQGPQGRAPRVVFVVDVPGGDADRAIEATRRELRASGGGTVITVDPDDIRRHAEYRARYFGASVDDVVRGWPDYVIACAQFAGTDVVIKLDVADYQRLEQLASQFRDKGYFTELYAPLPTQEEVRLGGLLRNLTDTTRYPLRSHTAVYDDLRRITQAADRGTLTHRVRVRDHSGMVHDHWLSAAQGTQAHRTNTQTLVDYAQHAPPPLTEDVANLLKEAKRLHAVPPPGIQWTTQYEELTSICNALLTRGMPQHHAPPTYGRQQVQQQYTQTPHYRAATYQYGQPQYGYQTAPTYRGQQQPPYSRQTYGRDGMGY